MSKEDEMVNALIEWHRAGDMLDVEQIEPEAHYNHYGTRGAADLFVREKDGTHYEDRVYEVKADAAVEEATGANEIIRQFNKLRQTFYQDDGRSYSGDTTFELVFVPSATTVEHVVKNIEMYASTDRDVLNPEAAGEYDRERVWFRTPTPDDMTPCQLTFPSTASPATAAEMSDFLKENYALNSPAPQTVVNHLRDLVDE